MKYSNLFMDKNLKAEEGDVFEELSTSTIFIYHDGRWLPFLPERESKVMVFPEFTPSTPEKELSAAPIGDTEGAEPAPVEEKVEEAPKPKKKASTSKKKSTKKETSK